jgi:hypothetical protein
LFFDELNYASSAKEIQLLSVKKGRNRHERIYLWRKSPQGCPSCGNINGNRNKKTALLSQGGF